MFSTRQYEWSDISVQVGGVDLTTLQDIEYKRSQEKEAVYGKGCEPVSVQRGNVAYDGKVSMLQSEYEALRAAGNGSVLNLQVDIVVSSGDASKGGSMQTDSLMGCEFTEESHSMSQGDKQQKIELPFIFLRLIPKQ